MRIKRTGNSLMRTGLCMRLARPCSLQLAPGLLVAKKDDKYSLGNYAKNLSYTARDRNLHDEPFVIVFGF